MSLFCLYLNILLDKFVQYGNNIMMECHIVEAPIFSVWVVGTTAVFLDWSNFPVKCIANKFKSSFFWSWSKHDINCIKMKLYIISSSAIHALGNVLKTQLDKHMPLIFEVPTVKDFMSPKTALFSRKCPTITIVVEILP